MVLCVTSRNLTGCCTLGGTDAISDEEEGEASSSLEDYLDKQRDLTETTTQAVKRVLAHQPTVAMKEQKISKAEMARRLHTSR